MVRPTGGSVNVQVHFGATDANANLDGIRWNIWHPGTGYFDNNGGGFADVAGSAADIAKPVALNQDGDWYFWTDVQDEDAAYASTGDWYSGFKVTVSQQTPPSASSGFEWRDVNDDGLPDEIIYPGESGLSVSVSQMTTYCYDYSSFPINNFWDDIWIDWGGGDDGFSIGLTVDPFWETGSSYSWCDTYVDPHFEFDTIAGYRYILYEDLSLLPGVWLPGLWEHIDAIFGTGHQIYEPGTRHITDLIFVKFIMARVSKPISIIEITNASGGVLGQLSVDPSTGNVTGSVSIPVGTSSITIRVKDTLGNILSGDAPIEWEIGGLPVHIGGSISLNPSGVNQISIGFGDGPSMNFTTACHLGIEYIGGTSSSNAQQESLVTLDEDYFMKGYMLKLSTPAIEPGTNVTWSITKSGSPAGTYHSDGAWTNYNSTLPSTPQSQTIYWRSDTDGSITDEYQVSATFRPAGALNTVTCTRVIKSRLLDSSVVQHHDNFNEDADMLQRSMVQVFYLDKGRLDVYRPGQYDRSSQNGFYRSSLASRATKDWSAIADEVWNFDYFTLGSFSASDPHPLDLSVVQGIWTQFGLILQAGVQGSVDTATAGYSTTWVPSAVNTAGLSMPSGFAKAAADVLKALVTQEGARHAYAVHSPLAVSSVSIGDAPSSSGGSHVYTDGGIGYCKVQPYNSGGRNIYIPQENLLRGAEILQVNINDVSNPGATANEKVWYGLFKYNRGSYGGGLTPAQLRNGGGFNEDSADYADSIFGNLALTPP